MKYRVFISVLALLMIEFLLPNQGLAAVEISAGVSFNQSYFTDDSYTWTRRYGASFGVFLTELTEIEIGYQDVHERVNIANYEDTNFHDNIYSLTVSQTLLSKRFSVQPYVKAGFGQLNREATGTYANGVAPPAVVDSLTGIVGAGIRVYLTRAFGIRGEATSYLTGGKISTWTNNTSVTVGISVYL